MNSRKKKERLPQVSKEIRQLHADLYSYDSEDRDWWDKFKGDPKIGARVYWYYKEEAQYYREEFGEEDGFDVRDHSQHSGILVPKPDVDRGCGDLDTFMVCVDAYPCEKENPRIDWVSLARLCDNPELVEVYMLNS